MERSVVLITGVTSGMGKATVELLSSSGYRVYGTTRNLEKYKQENKEIEGVEILEVDILSENSLERAVQIILKKESGIDVLINNAGYGTAGAVENTSIKEAQDQLDVNFFGTVRAINAVLPSMREKGSGLIINTSSIVGQMGIPYQAFYSASKYAIEGFTEALRMEVKGFGITVVMVEPGDVKSGFTGNRLRTKNSQKNTAYQEMMERSIAIVVKDEMKGSPPEKVAQLMLKILQKKSPRLRYTVGPTGQIISTHLKKYMPFGLWENMIMDHMKMK
ncbi:MAG: SDR family NAD(P)-dependent oxidoreductase [bacterium]|nr:SDR family NAD(P)-dependent oxidoreductase [bacterium]